MTTGTTTHGRGEMSCAQIAADGVAERYLLGQLAEPDQAAYELHYFDCERCFKELRALEAVRTQLHETPASPVQAVRSRGWTTWLGTAAAAALIVAVGVWVTRPGRAGAPIAQAPPASVVNPTTASGAAAIAELSRFDPPAYAPPVLRGPEDDARKAFRAAMEYYRRRLYRAAVEGLRRTVSLDPSAADASFFLGVSLLLAGDADTGATELRRTIGLGPSPYLEEAHFYLAKGLLQRGNVTAAREALRSMIALGGDRQAQAKELLTRLDR